LSLPSRAARETDSEPSAAARIHVNTGMHSWSAPATTTPTRARPFRNRSWFRNTPTSASATSGRRGTGAEVKRAEEAEEEEEEEEVEVEEEEEEEDPPPAEDTARLARSKRKSAATAMRSLYAQKT
jgi:hypothetical protein